MLLLTGKKALGEATSGRSLSQNVSATHIATDGDKAILATLSRIMARHPKSFGQGADALRKQLEKHMKKSALPATFLIVALGLSGATIATAQDAPLSTGSTDAAASQTDDARAVQTKVRGGEDGRDRDGRGRDGRHGKRGQMIGAFGPGGVAGLFEAADADGDGSLTQEEIDAYLADRIASADTDSDGSLALQEFAPIFYAQMEPRMVDAFQAFDADGSGEITTEEVDDRFGSLVERLDRDDDGALSMEDRGGRGRN